MHELSTALEICRVIETQLPAERLVALVGVGLEIGDNAGLEVANLQFCLDTLLAHPPFAGAAVVMDTVPGDDLRVSYLEVDDERTASVAGLPADAPGAEH